MICILHDNGVIGVNTLIVTGKESKAQKEKLN